MKDPVLQLLELRRRLISDRPWTALAFMAIAVTFLVTMSDPIAVVVAVALLVAAAALLTWHLLDKTGWIEAARKESRKSALLKLIASVDRLGQLAIAMIVFTGRHQPIGSRPPRRSEYHRNWINLTLGRSIGPAFRAATHESQR